MTRRPARPRPVPVDRSPALALRRTPALELGAAIEVALAAVLAAILAALLVAAPASAATGTYRNPLEPVIPGDGIVESCADPSVIAGQEDEVDANGDRYWYLYCTADPLNEDDKTAEGDFIFRLIPMLRSTDLVDWEYVGDAFTERPVYATPTAGIWAPEIEYDAATGRYLLYYTVTETTFGGSAIGVATSDGPLGPWEHADEPVVEPHAPDCCPNDRRWVFDPEVLQTDGGAYIYYGSYFGGISVRELSDDLMTSDPATQTNVGAANKWEGAEVVERDGWYYLFVSATDCCRGPLTGYAVFVGRSESPTGPFLDRSGIDLNDDEPLDDPTDGRIGGSPFLVGGGDWVGTGHNTVFVDEAGQWWTIYHAVDVNDPYLGVDVFGPGGNLMRRPALLDAIDWVDGWPVVNGLEGPTTKPQAAPAAQPGDRTTHRAPNVRPDRPTTTVFADEFDGTSVDAAWEWVREPAAETYEVDDGVLRWDTQPGDLFVDSDTASVLLVDAPSGNWVLDTRVRLSVPAEGCCFNYVQAGIVAYDGDDDFVKLVVASIWNTRQTEWAKEVSDVPASYPRYGNSIVGPPGEWTELRIVHRTVAGEETYTAYTRAEGGVWEKGMTWTHELGEDVRLGLVSMGGSGFEAEFDYVRVSRLGR